MAIVVTTNGFQRFVVQALRATAGAGPTYNVNRHLQTLSIDDSAVALTINDTAADDGGAPTNFYDVAFDALPTAVGPVATLRATVPKTQGNFMVRRVIIHDDAAANVDATSDTVVSGADGQTLQKTGDFAIEFVMTYTVGLAA